MMTWLRDCWVRDGKRSLLEWGCITVFDSSGQKGNRGSAERAGNGTHSFQSCPVKVRPELARKQGWAALIVPGAQPKHSSCEGASPTALRTAASRMDRGKLRTTEGLPNSPASSCKATERGKTISTRKPVSPSDCFPNWQPLEPSEVVFRPPDFLQAPAALPSMCSQVTHPPNTLLGQSVWEGTLPASRTNLCKEEFRGKILAPS